MGVQAAVAGATERRAQRPRTHGAALVLATAFVTACGGDRSAAPAQPAPQETTSSAGAQSRPAPASEGAALPPRALVAGVAGFRCVLQVEFAAAPDQPHQLELVQLFPARSYTCLSHQGPAGTTRAIELLAGDAAWRIEPATTLAQPLPEAARDELELRTALRAALVLWPDGYAWRSDPEVPDRHSAELGDPAAPRGRLVVDAPAGGAPTRARAESFDGTPLEELREITWAVHEGRSWPATAELWVGSERVWSESLVSASTRVSFKDEFFQPRLPAGHAAGTLSPAEDGH